MHSPTAAAPTERPATACSECRRRKQKCNQARPCSNCARRFPQPMCEYRDTRRKGGLPAPTYPGPFNVRAGDKVAGARDYPAHQEQYLARSPTDDQAVWDPLAEESEERGSWSASDVPAQWSFGHQRSPATNPMSDIEIPWGTTGCAAGPDWASSSDAHLKTVTCLRSGWEDAASGYDADWTAAFGSTTPASPLELLRTLPLMPTPLYGELLHIYIKLISRFKPALDGNPDPSGPYHEVLLPFCMQSPLLVNVAVYTTACFLHEMGQLDSTVVMQLKGQAISLLNKLLSSDRQDSAASDEAITAVYQLITDEWYWGEPRELRSHLSGLREMIRLRGGFRNLGLDGLLAKLVILCDLGIAIMDEEPPYLQAGPVYVSDDETVGPFRASQNTPLVEMPAFCSCEEGLTLHRTSLGILDDMRLLIGTVISLEAEPSPREKKKLQSMSVWTHERIAALPSESPYPATTTTTTTHPRPEAGSEQDLLYQSIRQAALIYTRAIIARRPLSESCPAADLSRAWTALRSVPSSAWRRRLGIFVWVVAALAPPAARDGGRHGRALKRVLTVASLDLGLDCWPVAARALGSVLALQAWLAGSAAGDCVAGPGGGLRGEKDELRASPD